MAERNVLACLLLGFVLHLIEPVASNDYPDFLGPPSWQSDWFVMRSQAGIESFQEVAHDLEEVPVKGKVLVRPMSGPNAGFMFEGVGSAQWDDDEDIMYCGLAFLYNDESVRLWAPSATDGYATGRIFCAGMDGWTDANGNAQAEHEAEVKILLWRETAFPEHISGIEESDIFSDNGATLYYERALGISGVEVDYITAHVRVEDASSVDWYSESIGSSVYEPFDVVGPISIQQGGLVGYYGPSNARTVSRRAHTVASQDESVVMISDGWAASHNAVEAGSGEVSMATYTNLGPYLFTYSFPVNLDSGDLPNEILLNTKNWDPTQSLVSLEFYAGPDPNSEMYNFFGTGVMARESFDDMTYGGVQFGYSQSTLRLFYPDPALSETCVASLSLSWGKAHPAVPVNVYQMCARSAHAKLKIWGPSALPRNTGSKKRGCTLVNLGSTSGTSSGSSSLARLTCVLGCLDDELCAAVQYDPTTTDCQRLDLGELNNRYLSQTNLDNVWWPRECTQTL